MRESRTARALRPRRDATLEPKKLTRHRHEEALRDVAEGKASQADIAQLYNDLWSTISRLAQRTPKDTFSVTERLASTEIEVDKRDQGKLCAVRYYVVQW